ncbi:reverse transcriptase domain-containing protein [Acidithiobacillus ferrianus]
MGILQDELVAGPSGQPESIHPQALLAQVLDRFIQQAIAQVISAQWEPHFHRHSYGFRPERSAHQAVREVQGTIRAGYGWVVDMDLQAFFDRVNHDRLMARLKSRTRGNTIGVIVAELRKALLGWKAYFGIAEVLSPLRDINKWVRRKLRCYLWKQWGSAGYRQLRKRGVSVREAWNTSKSAHGPWRLSKTPALTIALPLAFFKNLGVPSLAAR